MKKIQLIRIQLYKIALEYYEICRKICTLFHCEDCKIIVFEVRSA